MGKFSGFDVIA